MEQKTQVRVRLYGIDVPESGQDFGLRAKQAASALAFGKQVTIHEHDKDRYGRTVAAVFLPDGRSMGWEMVARGMAFWYRTYAPNDRELSRLESQAKTAYRGLWSQAKPIPPWDWRKGVGQGYRTIDAGISNSGHQPYLPSNRQFSCDSSRLACSGYRITTSGQDLATSGQDLTTREATHPRIDGENHTKQLGMLVALPDHQATAVLSSE